MIKRAVLTCCVFLASCGGGDSGTVGGTVTPPTTTTPTTTAPPAAPVVTFTTLYAFGAVPAAGNQPNGPLMQASDGNFYGTTRAGGTNGCTVGCGVLFKLTPDGTAIALHAFGDRALDGERPSAPLFQGRDGALYGTTAFGGVNGAGTIFKIALDGTYTVLYSFGASPTDGKVPVAGLIQASDGNFYGTTTVGGANSCTNVPGSGNNCGTIFRMSPSGVVTIMYSFGASVTDGVQPEAPLVQASDGNFYGTTLTGGANSCSTSGATNNCGTAFRMTPAGQVTVLHSFGQGASSGTLTTDGIAPQGPMIQGSDGALYGTTVSGGQGRCGGAFGCGTIFRMSTSGTISILHTFALTSTAEGDGPSPFLIQARDGNFYGTTGSGGALGGSLAGTVFRLTPAGAYTVLQSFNPSGGPSNPVGGLIQGIDGAFYGLTFYGRDGGYGTVFKLTVQ